MEKKEPTNMDLFQCLLELSKRLFDQKKITKLLLVISIMNLLLNLIQMILIVV